MGQGVSKRKLRARNSKLSSDAAILAEEGLKKMGTITYSPIGNRKDPRLESIRKANGSWKLIRTDTVGRSTEEFFETYELTNDVLGRGNYAEVRLARSLKTNETFAVKIMMKSQVDKTDIDDTRREVEILRNLNHENIVKVYEYYEDEEQLYILMEFLQGGELYNNVAELKDFTEKDTRDIIYTLIDALKYCKERGIAHRDIKPENILLRQKLVHEEDKKPSKMEYDELGLAKSAKNALTSFKVAKRKYEIALADFGFAKQISKSDTAALRTQCGTPLFLAPEIIQEKKYDYKCDVWSLGIVTYMLLSGGSYPFRTDNINALYTSVLECNWDFVPAKAWVSVSPKAKDFLRRTLVKNPKDRMTYDDMMAHPWFGDNSISRADKAVSVNFEALQRFNRRRTVMRKIKVVQAAVRFKRLMEDFDNSPKFNSNVALQKYIQQAKLTDFYNNPNLTTEAEKRGATLRRNDGSSNGMVEVKTDEAEKEAPTPVVKKEIVKPSPIKSEIDPMMYTSVDFVNIEDDL